ncbi:signal-regulatory protein beta-1-like [Ochotona princeps]|uniref:signal-regulatory protein beta-1-like n=1 Tax=Ochotona princeps TaxID=9978 RepID=UPI0027151665|nr:signal-regulatory protein beta-1-like [Ochotona princeps]
MAAVPGQVLAFLLPTILLGFSGAFFLAAAQFFISLTGPTSRNTPGTNVPFNCTAGTFPSQNINVTWLKDNDESPASAQYLLDHGGGNYSVSSKVFVVLSSHDLGSTITCEIAHSALAEPLRTTMNLSQVFQVTPTLKMTTKPSVNHLREHQRVNLTCHVSNFYPAHLTLTWMENWHRVATVLDPQVMRNTDGTYSLRHTWQAEATLEGSEFACWVVQDDQPPIRINITLRAQAQEHKKGRMAHSVQLQGPQQRSEPGTSIQLTYSSSRVQTQHVTVTWFKNSLELPRSQTSIQPVGDTYNVTSSVLVPLLAGDALSLVLCHVKHKSTLVFQQSVHLNHYLRVSPAVTVSQSSTSSGLVAVTCHVQRFYPQSVYVTWLEDCHPQNGTKQPLSKMNQDGSYSLESSYLVNMSAQRTERVFTCRVQHEAQSPIQASLILSAAAHTPLSSGLEMPAIIFVALLLGFKVLLVISFTVTYICKWWHL